MAASAINSSSACATASLNRASASSTISWTASKRAF
jgi:hypothetical protein